jgi:hypothetical protein
MPTKNAISNLQIKLLPIIKKVYTFWLSPLQNSQSFNGLRLAPEFELVLTRKNGTSVNLVGYLIKENNNALFICLWKEGGFAFFVCVCGGGGIKY